MRLRTLVAVSLVALADADASWCQEKQAGELDRWVPSFGATMAVVRQGAKGFQRSNLRPPPSTVTPPTTPPPGTPLTGDDYLLDPFAGFTAELMSPGISVPGIDSIPGRPRLFVHGEVGGAFGSAVTLAKEGSPGPFVVPDRPGSPGLPSSAVGGQGSKTTLETDPFVTGAGAGIAFTADLFGRRFRVKPSFEYLRDEVTAAGVMKDAEGVSPNYTLIVLRRQETRSLNYVGGGLELEMDTVRVGPFVLALFANGQAYRLLDDRNIDLSATEGPNTAIWNVKLDPEAYRGGLGLRFRYFPIED